MISFLGCGPRRPLTAEKAARFSAAGGPYLKAVENQGAP
jgi:hypothetical protein